ncbi:hypothetical protein GGR22_000729 [Flavobacterium gossypii]|uniref:Uncharacterized protein n=1 Tax=Flavobacterium gossypii TaxID=1646119 RepID=A0ABR6DLN6_9FLAO|nr:hypothetical protein [Flavobacterium gossypii]MBA9072603.1 hypothetical protein [Flavobacterium gossypii]
MEKIKVIPFKDRKKDSPCYLKNSHWTDDEIRCRIIADASSNLNFEEIKKLVEILDQANIDELRNNIMILQINESYVKFY